MKVVDEQPYINDNKNVKRFPDYLPIKFLYSAESRVLISIFVLLVCVFFFIPVFILLLINIKKKLFESEESNKLERSIIRKSYRSDKDENSVILLGIKESNYIIQLLVDKKKSISTISI